MSKVKVIPGLYRHYKGGLYRVIGTGIHTETEEPLVSYIIDGEESPDTRVWNRPLEMFAEQVEVDGKMVPRFELIESSSLFAAQRAAVVLIGAHLQDRDSVSFEDLSMAVHMAVSALGKTVIRDMVETSVLYEHGKSVDDLGDMAQEEIEEINDEVSERMEEFKSFEELE